MGSNCFAGIDKSASAEAQKGSASRTTSSGKLLDSYTLGKILGQGAFGVVYSCNSNATGKEYAVKMIDKVESPIADIKREIEMLELLSSSYIVKLHNSYFEKVFIYMVMDLLKGGDLIEGMTRYWTEKGMLPLEVVRRVGAQMLNGIVHLHSRQAGHFDIKGDNYLMDRKQIEHPDNRILLSDFGTVELVKEGERRSKACGTKLYWAPEFYRLSYGLKVDVFAAGVILHGLFEGKFPFKNRQQCENKEIQLSPKRCPEDGLQLALGILHKDEKKRLTAADARNHSFLAEGQAPYVAEDLKSAAEYSPEVKETGANGAVKERRKELVDRIQESHLGQNHKPSNPASDFQVTHSSVLVGSSAKTAKFRWWTQGQADQEPNLKLHGAKPVLEDDFCCRETTKDMLTKHGINLGLFGKGKAKTFEDFFQEIQNGSARLMLDATKHKTLVRVVDVVLLRLSYAAPGGRRYLIQQSELLPDGRMSDGLSRLPGTKKLPHENSHQVARRVIEEQMRMSDAGIVITTMKAREEFEEPEESGSFPGLLTVYKKRIVEAEVTTKTAEILQRIGCNTKGRVTVEDTRTAKRSFEWIDEAACKAKAVKTHAPAGRGEVSALVFPPCGLDEEELKEFLQKSGVDESAFGKHGTKTLKDFADELVKGESTLLRRPDGTVQRSVDIVVLKIVRNDGRQLVEAEEELDGVSKTLKRFPAVKRRSDENQFLAAHRCIQVTLNLDENQLDIDRSNVMTVDAECDSKQYPGIRTQYKKRIITCRAQV